MMFILITRTPRGTEVWKEQNDEFNDNEDDGKDEDDDDI